MIRRASAEAVAAARAAQAAFRRAGEALAGARGREERQACWRAFVRARALLNSVPAEVRQEAAAVELAERAAERYGVVNPTGAERLRRWARST